MVQVINDPTRGNLFGRIARGVAQGVNEQLPKEVSQYRLASGLRQFEKDSGNLTPLQQLSRLSSIPGALEHPQLIESFGRLAQQQQRANALKIAEKIPPPSPFPKKTTSQPGGKELPPSITKEDPLAKVQEGYIPKTQDQIIEDAGQRFEANPQLYNNDPQLAIQAAEQDDIRNQNIAQAYQKQHENLSQIQDNVVNRLKQHAENLGARGIVPANVYSRIEDKAIQATKPKKEGGQGLTEQQAMKIYGNELDQVAREYKDIDSIGSWSMTTKKPSEIERTFKTLQENFEKRDDTENLADKLVAVNGLSYGKAYQRAQPVSKVKPLNQFLSGLPKLKTITSYARGFPEFNVPDPELSRKETLKIAPKLADFVKNNEKASPLAIAEELKMKNYDPGAFLDYLTENSEYLNLRDNQIRQLRKPKNINETLGDWWLSSWSGIEE